VAARVKDRYKGIYYDDTDVLERVQDYGHHEWNTLRLAVIGRIRNESLRWAKEHNSHYFSIDCDCFIQPHTLETLMSYDLPIVAPLLHTGIPLWNYYAKVSPCGYFGQGSETELVGIKGIIEVPLVHCSYLIRYDYLDKLTYTDTTERYEYIIFSDSARQHDIQQYVDARELYGWTTATETAEQFSQEPWLNAFEWALRAD
jgi:hypothetical protein